MKRYDSSTMTSQDDEDYLDYPPIWYESIDWSDPNQVNLAQGAMVSLLIDIKHYMHDLNFNIKNIQTHKMDLEFSIRPKPKKRARKQ